MDLMVCGFHKRSMNLDYKSNDINYNDNYIIFVTELFGLVIFFKEARNFSGEAVPTENPLR